MSLLEDLNWRHAVKAYDPSKKVSEADLQTILEATRLAPTSSGLQPFRVIVVENQDLKEKMVAGALNPEVMRDSSHVLVFAAWDSYSNEKIDKVYDYHTDVRDLPRGRFGSYTDKIKEIYGAQTPEQHFAHTARQTYIALGIALAQAAELKIDSTPAEGFSNEVVDEVLGLKELGLKSVSLLYLGYRDEANDWLSGMKKVRVPMDEFIIKK
ncbi:NAD(P)H-dependent oxidoreductase [Chryseobacterium indologenes]|uniref:NAD(P)H-dependent oxidoreductase n=1 Tax=Chryseobacterium indologenes TaxID=253 RepID=A0A1Z3VXZ6_CHRID|nr:MULTISPECIES: NAD(P)H-dependent oxidoreductase [Chryseobacterium]ASE60395.1 NAD(P)H-dependent oxidoreductase [Chryseobacterium indologenes]ATN04581.1 NAD(P)H-dependent oxidoreductase [Chryseobacterium indologenes]AYY86667.1 NAD(P)H-dependent oxidoreductase [Chryseobacterium indologenes]AYZ36553.1 NAD(P)H-dependent oxidoreductase [Chryseobacterium indologenes]AZB20301.1 NAD(P)H-dependent oxidoreductase [Chryseobacterium indologenes]